MNRIIALFFAVAFAIASTASCTNSGPVCGQENASWESHPLRAAPIYQACRRYEGALEAQSIVFSWNGQELLLPTNAMPAGVAMVYTDSGLAYGTGEVSRNKEGDITHVAAQQVYANGRLGPRFDRIEYLTMEHVNSCYIKRYNEETHRNEALPDRHNICGLEQTGFHCVCLGSGKPFYVAARGNERFVMFGDEQYGPYDTLNPIVYPMIVATDEGPAPRFYLLKSVQPPGQVSGFIVVDHSQTPHTHDELNDLLRRDPMFARERVLDDIYGKRQTL